DQDRGIYHLALLVMNFDTVSALHRKSTPVWEGIWTGQKFLRLVKTEIDGAERLFVFVLNDDREIELWEISKDAKWDEGNKRIKWAVEGRSLPFKSAGEYKRLHGAEFWLADVSGELDWKIRFKPDRYPCFFDWAKGHECAKSQDCSVDLGQCVTVKQ